MHQLGEDGRFLTESCGVGRRVGKGGGSRGGVLVVWVSVSRCRGGGGDLAGGGISQGGWVPRCRVGPNVRGGSPNAQHSRITKTSICVFVVIPFTLDVMFVDVPAGAPQEEGHTGFFHLPSALIAFIFLARRIQPFLSVVDREVELCVPTESIVLHVLGIFIFIFCEEKSQFV